MPLVPWVSSWQWWNGIEIAHHQVAWFGFGIFIYLIAIDMIWMKDGGFEWERRKKKIKVEFTLGILCLIFGLYIVSILLIIFILLMLLMVVDGIFPELFQE